jgi:hypothetical protein
MNMMVVELGYAGKTMKMSKEEQVWRAEEDLRVLMEAKKIKADKSRYAAAVAQGRERLDRLMKIVGDDDAAEVKS